MTTATAPSRSGSALLKIFLTLIFLGAIAVGVLFFLFGKVVPPNFIGVRQNYFGIFGLVQPGYTADGIEPGLAWEIPGISKIHLIPRDFQMIHFTNVAQPTEGDDLNLPALEIPTTDGSKVKTDLTLVVRLFDRPEGKQIPHDAAPLPPEPAPGGIPEAVGGPSVGLIADASVLEVCDEAPLPYSGLGDAHGGPKNLFAEYGTEPRQWFEKLRQISENELKRDLGSLKSVQYYNPCDRERETQDALNAINRRVNPSGIELWGVLIRRYNYSDRSIDDQIFAKNLQEQTQRMNAAASRLAGAKANTEQKRAEWDAKIRDLEVEIEAKVGELRSVGELYEAKQKAEADLLVAKSGAAIDLQKAQTLTDAAGAEAYIGRQLAPLLGTLQGGIVTNIDPYNVDAWVDKFLGKEQPKEHR